MNKLAYVILTFLLFLTSCTPTILPEREYYDISDLSVPPYGVPNKIDVNLDTFTLYGSGGWKWTGAALENTFKSCPSTGAIIIPSGIDLVNLGWDRYRLVVETFYRLPLSASISIIGQIYAGNLDGQCSTSALMSFSSDSPTRRHEVVADSCLGRTIFILLISGVCKDDMMAAGSWSVTKVWLQKE